MVATNLIPFFVKTPLLGLSLWQRKMWQPISRYNKCCMNLFLIEIHIKKVTFKSKFLKIFAFFSSQKIYNGHQVTVDIPENLHDIIKDTFFAHLSDIFRKSYEIIKSLFIHIPDTLHPTFQVQTKKCKLYYKYQC